MAVHPSELGIDPVPAAEADRQVPAGGGSPRAARWQAAVLVGTAGIGWIASVLLSVEQFTMQHRPGYRPACSISSVLSCVSVMNSGQAAVFGFANSIIGVVGFAVVVAAGLLAAAGRNVPVRVWRVLWLGVATGTVFAGWLIFQALYRIGSLCPYCMVVWAMMPALLALLTRQASGRAPGPIATIVGWRWTVAVLMYAVVILLVFLRFQDYWLSLW